MPQVPELEAVRLKKKKTPNTAWIKTSLPRLPLALILRLNRKTWFLLPIPNHLLYPRHLWSNLYFTQSDPMQSLIQEGKEWVAAGETSWLLWKPCSQGLNGFLFADVQFFRAGPGIGRGLGTASCVSRFPASGRGHPPQQVSREQAGCPDWKLSSWPLVLLLLPSPAGKRREAEGVSSALWREGPCFLLHFILPFLIIQTRTVGHLPVSLLASCPCHSPFLNFYLSSQGLQSLFSSPWYTMSCCL